MNFVRILSGRISAAGGELVPWLMLAAGLVVFVLAAFRSVRLFRTWLASLLGRGNLNDALGMLKHVQSGVDDRVNRPRSLNGMERIYLPHIARAFPRLQIDAMGSQAESLLIRSYEALAGGIDPELKADFGPYYYDALTRLITQNEAQGEDRARFEQVKVHQRVLSHYGWREGKRIIEFQFAVEAFMSSPARPEPAKQQLRNTLRFQYLEDSEAFVGADGETTVLTQNCPNCGAPLRGAAAELCPYCRSEIKKIQLETWLPVELLPEGWTEKWLPDSSADALFGS